MAIRENIISPEQAGTIAHLFQERVRRTPDATAYRFFDALNGTWSDATWRDMAMQVRQWQQAMSREKLKPGARVAIMAKNSRFWVLFDQAALSLGLVVVPIFSDDRADNVRYILESTATELLLIGGQPQWERLHASLEKIKSLKRIVSIAEVETPESKRLMYLNPWLSIATDHSVNIPPLVPDDIATVVFTSGTTGLPKGVTLSHRNILSNAFSGLQAVPIHSHEVFLSFLPLSHTLERTVGYYLPMMAGATVAHARSIQDLAKDLLEIRPQCLVSVPRIYERVYARIREGLKSKSALAGILFKLAVALGWRRFELSQGRGRWSPVLLLHPLLHRLVAARVNQSLGGKLRVAICGGAALSPEIARIYTGLDVPILQGYGLTEAAPVVSVNRLERNIPTSIGPALPGVEVRIGDNDELLVRGDNVMPGYWNDPAATRQAIDADGWLHTGDKARIEDEFIYITGRIKDIIVLDTGEKIPPADMELAITMDPLFAQVLVIGEGRPFLSALVVLDQAQLEHKGPRNESMTAEQFEEFLLTRITDCLHDFPGYAKIFRVTVVDEPWTVENDLLTPTLKIKRQKVMAACGQQIEQMYQEDRTPGAKTDA